MDIRTDDKEPSGLTKYREIFSFNETVVEANKGEVIMIYAMYVWR